MVVSTTPKAILLGSIASWLTCQQIRIVFFQGRVYENAKGIFRGFCTALDRLAIALSTRAVFVSNSLLAAYEYEGLVELEQGKVVGSGSVNGVDVDRFCATKYGDAEIAELKHTLGIRSDHLVSLTVGRICRDKGLIELFQLADALSGSAIVFVVVGSVEPGNESDAFALFSLPNVRYVPFTDEVQRYFTMSDVHLFLSHREGFGNVALEAASCGVPTIAFDVIGVKDSVADGISGIRVPPGDLNTIRKILEAIVLDRQAFRNGFNAAREWVLKCYAHQKVWRSFLDFYRVNEITK
jgi:glycosyltransferase involved in cell wall biosynthesis